MDRIVEEVFATMLAAGYRTHWPQPKQFLEVFYSRLVPDTAEHTSLRCFRISPPADEPRSMPSTAPSSTSPKKHGIVVPYNLALFNLVRFLESRHGA